MELRDITAALAGSLLGASPYMVAWIVAIVLSLIMINRGGGRAERFLLAGSCVMLAIALLRIPVPLAVPWLIEGGRSTVRAASLISIYQLVLGVIGMAGIICLIYAFWSKFWVGYGSQ